MTTLQRHPFLIFSMGLILGGGAMLLIPREPVKASAAHGNDVMSMATVPVTNGYGDTEAVFVLDHLTGVVRGGVLNTQTGKFTYLYQYAVANDFALNPSTPNPKYSIVGGNASLRASGGITPANGVLYIAENSSGTVLGYTFAAPRGRGAAAPLPLIPVDGFSFREAIGG